MSEAAWWVIIGVAVLLALAGALRFDVLGLFLRDRLEHPDAPAGRLPAEDVPPAPEADAQPQHPHPVPRHKPPFHRSGRRH